MPTHVTQGTNGYIVPEKLGSNTPSSSNWLRGDGAWVTIPSGAGGGIAASLGGNTAGVMALVSTGTMMLMGGNNITLSQNGQSITVSGPSLTNYLTTAAQSDHSHTQYLTTAALSNHSHNLATTTTNGSVIVVGTANSAGATIGVPPFLTTAQPAGAYLTTARASNDAIGLNTALTANGVAWTVNSSGLSLNVPAFLTTAAQSNHSHGNPSLALTNLSGTTNSNSAGLTISLSAAAPGGGGAINVSAGTTSGNLQTVQFNNSNGISFGLNGSTVTASHNGLTTAAQSDHSHGNPTLALTNLSGTTASASNGLTISLSAAAAGGGGADPVIRWTHSPFNQSNNLLTNVTALTQRPIFVPIFIPGSLSANEMMWPMSRSTSGSNHFTMHVGVYTMANDTSMNLLYSTSGSYSATATASVSGIRLFELPLGSQMSTLTQGQYVLGAIFSATATASMNYSLMGNSTANPVVGGIHTGADTYWTHTSHHFMPMWGRYSTTTGALPAAVGASHVIGAITGASQPLPWAFTFGSDY